MCWNACRDLWGKYFWPNLWQCILVWSGPVGNSPGDHAQVLPNETLSILPFLLQHPTVKIEAPNHLISQEMEWLFQFQLLFVGFRRDDDSNRSPHRENTPSVVGRACQRWFRISHLQLTSRAKLSYEGPELYLFLAQSRMDTVCCYRRHWELFAASIVGLLMRTLHSLKTTHICFTYSTFKGRNKTLLSPLPLWFKPSDVIPVPHMATS